MLFVFLEFIPSTLASVKYPRAEEQHSKKYQLPPTPEYDYQIFTSPVKLYADLAGEQTEIGQINQGALLLINKKTGKLMTPYGYDTAILEGHTMRQRINLLSAVIDSGLFSSLFTSFSKPTSNELFITTKPISVFSQPKQNSTIFAKLNENIRYPIQAKLVDETGQYWYQIFLGGNIVYVEASSVDIDKGISVLTYHHILNTTENRFYQGTSTTISAEAFERQLTHLQSLGYRSITLDELYAFLQKKKNLPSKVFVITFDDGLKSVHRYGYPVLKKLGLKATIFMITSRIKRKVAKWNPDSLQFMSIQEITEAKEIFTYESHSHFLHKLHNKKPIIYQRSQHVIEFDTERSLRALHQFNPLAKYFAYPFGAYDAKAIDAIKKSGVKMAFSTVRGRVKPGDNLHKLKRIYLLTGDDNATVENKIAN